MNPNLMHTVIPERQSELERQAGCCTPAAEHRRAIGRHGLLGRNRPPQQHGNIRVLLRVARTPTAKSGSRLWRGEECDCHPIPGLDTTSSNGCQDHCCHE